MERFAQQDAAQKATTEQLDALAAILAPLIGNLNNPTVAIKRQLFNTDQTCLEKRIIPRCNVINALISKLSEILPLSFVLVSNPLFTATLSPRNVTEKEAEPINRTDQPRDSSAKAVSVDPMSRKPNAKAVVSSEASAKTHEVMFFKDVKFGPQEGELRFRLIHFWEARNAIKKVLIVIAFFTTGYCDPRIHPIRKD
ncbi:hypothetical protein YC2023_060912 [Brassica napus]